MTTPESRDTWWTIRAFAPLAANPERVVTVSNWDDARQTVLEWRAELPGYEVMAMPFRPGDLELRKMPGLYEGDLFKNARLASIVFYNATGF